MTSPCLHCHHNHNDFQITTTIHYIRSSRSDCQCQIRKCGPRTDANSPHRRRIHTLSTLKCRLLNPVSLPLCLVWCDGSAKRHKSPLVRMETLIPIKGTRCRMDCH